MKASGKKLGTKKKSGPTHVMGNGTVMAGKTHKTSAGKKKKKPVSGY
tara:strand:+ start:238 stop:378 length:141 start_codon:yes stop_codon:yes gene_type:complete